VYTYDNNGNQTSKTLNGANQLTLVYDKANRMVKGVNALGEQSLYTYNVLGALVNNTKISGTAPQVSGNYVVDYTVDTKVPLLVTESGGNAYRNTYGVNTASGPGKISVKTTNAASGALITKLYLEHDHLGSTRFATADNGSEAAYIDYSAWGVIGADSANLASLQPAVYNNLKSFTGHNFDGVLNLYYAKARMYDPNTKRFIQQDPSRQGLNWYSYVGNNPVNFVDPTGKAGKGPYDGYSSLSEQLNHESVPAGPGPTYTGTAVAVSNGNGHQVTSSSSSTSSSGSSNKSPSVNTSASTPSYTTNSSSQPTVTYTGTTYEGYYQYNNYTVTANGKTTTVSVLMNDLGAPIPAGTSPATIAINSVLGTNNTGVIAKTPGSAPSGSYPGSSLIPATSSSSTPNLSGLNAALASGAYPVLSSDAAYLNTPAINNLNVTGATSWNYETCGNSSIPDIIDPFGIASALLGQKHVYLQGFTGNFDGFLSGSISSIAAFDEYGNIAIVVMTGFGAGMIGGISVGACSAVLSLDYVDQLSNCNVSISLSVGVYKLISVGASLVFDNSGSLVGEIKGLSVSVPDKQLDNLLPFSANVQAAGFSVTNKQYVGTDVTTALKVGFYARRALSGL